MRFRNIAFIILLVVELGLLVFFSIKKMDHVVNKITSITLTVVILFVSGWMMLFPPYKELSPTGNYEVAYISENYVDENRIEEFLNDGSKREL